VRTRKKRSRNGERWDGTGVGRERKGAGGAGRRSLKKGAES